MFSCLITADQRARSASMNSAIAAALRGRSAGKADLLQRGAEGVVVQRAVETGADLLRDIVRQLRGRRDAKPDADAVIGITALGDGRHVRQIGASLLRTHAQWPQQTAFHRRQRRAQRVEHHLDVAGQQIGQRRPRAPVGDVNHVDARDLLEHLAGQMDGAAGAGRSEIDLAGILPWRRRRTPPPSWPAPRDELPSPPAGRSSATAPEDPSRDRRAASCRASG